MMFYVYNKYFKIKWVYEQQIEIDPIDDEYNDITIFDDNG